MLFLSGEFVYQYCILATLLLHSWSPWTMLFRYGAAYSARWLPLPPSLWRCSYDALMMTVLFRCSARRLEVVDVMIWLCGTSLAVCWCLALPPTTDIYLTYYRTCLLLIMDYDSTTPMMLMMFSSFVIPPGDVPVVEVMFCCVCAPVQPSADEHLLCRGWVSHLQPLIALWARWTVREW